MSSGPMAYDLIGLFERVRTVLSERPRTPLAALAAELGVERHTLERAVRKAAGASVRTLRARVLLEASGMLLREQPWLSVKEVAARAGYPSARAFAAAFKRASGMSPMAFRAAAHGSFEGLPPNKFLRVGIIFACGPVRLLTL